MINVSETNFSKQPNRTQPVSAARLCYIFSAYAYMTAVNNIELYISPPASIHTMVSRQVMPKQYNTSRQDATMLNDDAPKTLCTNFLHPKHPPNSPAPQCFSLHFKNTTGRLLHQCTIFVKFERSSTIIFLQSFWIRLLPRLRVRFGLHCDGRQRAQRVVRGR